MVDPRVQLIALSGALDLATERRLRADVSQAAGDPSRGLVIDVREVTFMDSSTLAVLVHGDQQFKRQGRSLAFIVGRGPVRQLLDATGLREALAVFETAEDAVAHVVRSDVRLPR